MTALDFEGYDVFVCRSGGVSGNYMVRFIFEQVCTKSLR